VRTPAGGGAAAATSTPLIARARAWRGRPAAVIGALEIALLGVFALLPLALVDFWVVFVTRVLILALLALSFDLVWGFAGIMSFGQALFFGAAGYTVALLARDAGIVSAFVVLPVAVLVGLVLAFLVAGFLLLGRNPPSLTFVALGTLTGSYAGDRLARGWYYLGGQNGIPSIPPMTAGPVDLLEGRTYYYLALAFLVAVYAGCRLLVGSQLGLALAGIRINEARMAFLGYRVPWAKALVFSVAGAIAGLAGGLYAFHEGFVWPNMMGVILSTQIVLYALFGGVGTLIGPVLGVVAIEIASFELADRYPTIWPIILGALLLVVILFRPRGLISLLVPPAARVRTFGLRGRRPQPASAGEA
jgi:branched-chain amino acid transport system permease protein